MSKRFRVCSLDQEFLLPPSLQDWLPEDHLARFIADVAKELDLSAIYAEYERRETERTPIRAQLGFVLSVTAFASGREIYPRLRT
jgi:hypothetical protein